MTIEQIRTGKDNFTYLMYSSTTREAALVDPGIDASPALARISELELGLDYVINTHHHFDHSSANQSVKKLFIAQVLAHQQDAPKVKGGADTDLKDGQLIELGEISIKVLHTPGHTEGGICLLVKDEPDNTSHRKKHLLTGDTLFIGDCGRTDLADGSNSKMYKSLQRIKELDDDIIIYPGHDYGNKPHDTLGNQKKVNKALLCNSLEEFIAIP